MERLKRIPDPGDHVEFNGVRFTVEIVEGKRATSLRVDLHQPHPQEQPR
jgi:CBS domain containing-hemolysin-like protein